MFPYILQVFNSFIIACIIRNSFPLQSPKLSQAYPCLDYFKGIKNR